MTTPVFKLLILIKRRPGMSVQEFRDYYENKHSKLGDDIGVKVGVVHYMRRYLEPLNGGELEYDVLTEVWFEDPAKLDRVAGPLSRGEFPPEVAADEERFMDRTKTRFLKVVEHESKI
jgi:EthD domain